MDADALANAFCCQARNVVYNDYDPKDDFSLWLAGYKEKVRNAFGFNRDQDAEVEAEVVRSITGKLSCGTALDTYNRLPEADKTDYNRLVEALTKEFVDPQERRRFIEDFSYNKRKKGQSLKDFMQEIINDQNRYSGMQNTIQVGAAAVPNSEKVRNGIRRFKNGIRDRKGKKDKDQICHFRYNLQDDDDLTWENALKVAGRWEAANELGSSTEESSDSGDDEPMAAIALKRKSKRESLKKTDLSLASLSLKVNENSKDIQEIRENQVKFNADLETWKEEQQATLNAILAAVQGPDEQDNF